MKNNDIKKQKDINVIVLRDRVHNSKEEVIDDYIEKLKVCRTGKEFYDLLENLYDEAVLLTGERFVELQIQKNAEILEEMRNELF